MSRRHDLHPHEQISAFLDGELSGSEAHSVEAHLASCAECRSLAADLRILDRAIASEDVPVLPDTLAPRIGWSIRSASSLGAGAETADVDGADAGAGSNVGLGAGAGAGRATAGRRRWTLARSSLAAGSLVAASILLFLVVREDPMKSARITTSPAASDVKVRENTRQDENGALRLSGKDTASGESPAQGAASTVFGSPSAFEDVARKPDASNDRSLEKSIPRDGGGLHAVQRVHGGIAAPPANAAGGPAGRLSAGLPAGPPVESVGVAPRSPREAAPEPAGKSLSNDRPGSAPKMDAYKEEAPRQKSAVASEFSPVPPASAQSKDKASSRNDASTSNRFSTDEEAKKVAAHRVPERAAAESELRDTRDEPEHRGKGQAGAAEGAKQGEAGVAGTEGPNEQQEREENDLDRRAAAAQAPQAPPALTASVCAAPFEPIPGPIVVRTPDTKTTLESLRRTVARLGGSIRKTSEHDSEWRIEIPPERYNDLLAWVRSHRNERIPRAVPAPPRDDCALLRIQLEPPIER